MAAPSLNITKSVKNAVTSAAAQTIIAIILTVGFVSVQVLSGLGYFLEGQYGLIMGYFGPIEAIVVGFYFAVNIRKNDTTSTTDTGTGNGLIAVVDKLIQQLTASSGATATILQTLNQMNAALQVMGKAIIAASTSTTETPATAPTPTADQSTMEDKTHSREPGSPTGLFTK